MLSLSIVCGSCVMNRNSVVPSKDMVSYEVEADDISFISASSSIQVVYTQGSETKVTVECPDNLVDLLNIGVGDGQLEAEFKHGVTIDGDCSVTVSVVSPSLKGVDVSSSSYFGITQGLVQTGGLTIDASSSAEVDIKGLQAAKVEIDASSSARVRLDGLSAATLEADASSSSKIVVAGIRCEEVAADASSASTIRLSGEASRASFDASSAASIEAKGLMVVSLNHAKATSAASIECSAESCGQIIEESSGNVSCR